MFEKMRAALLTGCTVVTTHTVHFCYSYRLCIEDVRVRYHRCTEANLTVLLLLCLLLKVSLHNFTRGIISNV